MFYIFIMLIAGMLAANVFGFLSMDLLLFLLFLTAIALFIYWKRSEVRREGIMIIHRTRKGVSTIDNIARKYPGLWGKLAAAGVVVSVLAMFAGAYMLFDQAYKIYSGSSKTPGVGLLLPGPASTPVTLPGLFIIPWWIWVVGIAVVMFPHEIAHGIVCRLEKIRIKSVGWLFLLFLPGAFVEPDEKQLQRSGRSVKMKVYAAGSFANIIVGLLLLALLSAWFSFGFQQGGVAFFVVNDTPASRANLSGSIIEMDGVPVKSHEEISSLLEQKKPGDTVDVKTLSNGEIIPAVKLGLGGSGTAGAVVQGSEMRSYSITLAEHPEKPGRALLGIANPVPAGSFAGPVLLYLILFWAFLFSIAIGVINLLPIKPLDGGLLFEELTGAVMKDNRFVVKLVGMLVAFLLLFNFFGPAVVG